MGCWRTPSNCGCGGALGGKRQRQRMGIDPNRCPGHPTSPTPHCGAMGGEGGGEGGGRGCVCTPIARTPVHTRGSDEGSTGPSCSPPPPEQCVGGHRDPHPHPCLCPPHGHVCQRQVPPIRWEGQVGVAGSRYGEGDVDGSGDGGGGAAFGPGVGGAAGGNKAVECQRRRKQKRHKGSGAPGLLLRVRSFGTPRGALGGPIAATTPIPGLDAGDAPGPTPPSPPCRPWRS